jgi:hypothetical protein
MAVTILGTIGGPKMHPTDPRTFAYTLLRASSSTAEQRTLNPQVSGSNPEGRTRKCRSDAVYPEELRGSLLAIIIRYALLIRLGCVIAFVDILRDGSE